MTATSPTDAKIVEAVADVLPDHGAWPDDWPDLVDDALESMGVETVQEFVNEYVVAVLGDGRWIVLSDPSRQGVARYSIHDPSEDD